MLFFVCLIASSTTAQYCIPTYTNSCSGTGSYINKFTFHTLNNSNSGCNGNSNNYIFYTPTGNKTTSVVQGTIVAFSVKSGSGAGNDQGFGIWVDWNADGDFSDADELVYCAPGLTDDLISGTIPIPVNENYLGLRRLRVRSARDALIFPHDYCKNFTNGETEDYDITVLPAPSCTGLPVAGTVYAFPSGLCNAGGPVTLMVAGYSSASGLDFQWQRSNDGLTWTDLPDATTPVINISFLAVSTYFRVAVTCIPSGLTQYSDVIYVGVGPASLDLWVSDTICGTDTAKLVADGLAQNIYWYHDSTDVIPFASTLPGDTMSLLINASTTVFAEAVSGSLYVDTIGLANPLGWPGSDAYLNGFMVFDVFEPCTLAGVYVYPSSSGWLHIFLRDSAFNTLNAAAFQVPSGSEGQRTFVPLNFALIPGSGFQLFLSDESEKVWSVQGTIGYPFEMTGVVRLRTSNLGPGYYHYFFDWIFVHADLCRSSRQAVAATVITPPQLEVISLSSKWSICTNESDSLTLLATSGFDSYHWAPALGLSTTQQPVVKTLPPATTTYTLTAELGECVSQAQVQISVYQPPVVQVTPKHDTLCAGNSVLLTTTVSPALNYTVEPIAFMQNDTVGTIVALNDDELQGPFPIGFSFWFYGNYYQEFYISSNGYITFDATGGDGCCTGQLLPNPFPPNNLIALAWEDLAPNLGGNVSYYTTGIAPYRKLVVRFDQVPHYSQSGPADPVTVRVELHEHQYRIEIHTANMPGNPAGNWFGHTQGLESPGGLQAAVVPGRNSSSWTASNSAYRFLPQLYSYTWTPSAGLDNSSSGTPVASPQVSTVYTVTVANSVTGCSASQSATIDVVQVPKAGIITPGWTLLCDTAAVELNVQGYTEGASLQWQYFDSALANFMDVSGATGHTLTVIASDVHQYRVQATCASSAYSDTAHLKVMHTPQAPVAMPVSRCGPGKIVLTATATSDLICWYNKPAGGTFLGMGPSLVVPSLLATDTFWVEAGPPPSLFVNSSLDGGAIEEGIMFNILAHENIMIHSIDVHLIQASDIPLKIYYRKGSFQGFEQNALDWIFCGSITVQGKGFGNLTSVPLPLNLTIPSGSSYALYVSTTAAALINTAVAGGPDVFLTDSMISLTKGVGVSGLFGSSTGSRLWNGRLHYSVLACSGPRTPVVATIYYPQIVAVVNDSFICALDTIQLQAINLGLGTYFYQWYPLLEGTDPPDGASALITTIPVQSTLFTLLVNEVNNECDTIVQLYVEVSPLPEVLLIGLPDTMHTLMGPVALTGLPGGGVFSGPGIVNGNFFDPAVAGPGNHKITYAYTDPQGCTNQAVRMVTVLLYSGHAGSNAQLSVYPNPASDFVFIACSTCNMPVAITITDLTGRQLLPLKTYRLNQPLAISTHSWPPGIYWITVYVDGQKHTLPLVLTEP